MRYINTDFWTDTWVVDSLNPLDRYLFIYLFTNAHANLIGTYNMSLRVMSFETGIEREELIKMLKRLEPKVYYSNGWVVMRNGIKNQNYNNSKIRTGILLALEHVPSELLQHIAWPKDFGNPKPMGSNQTKLIDDLYMSHDESSHSNSNSNLIKLNSNARGAESLKNKITKPEPQKPPDKNGPGYLKFKATQDKLKSRGV